MIREVFFVWQTHMAFLIYASNFLKLYIHMYLQTCISTHNTNAYEVLSDSHKHLIFEAIFVLS